MLKNSGAFLGDIRVDVRGSLDWHSVISLQITFWWLKLLQLDPYDNGRKNNRKDEHFRDKDSDAVSAHAPRLVHGTRQ